MSIRTLFTRGRLAGLALAAIVLVAAGWAWFGRIVVADGETASVTRGVYTDVVEIRGQVQPVRSTYVTAPYNAGELQILKMASNGTAVKGGDVVAEFDAVTLRRTIQEKQSELRTAKAELAQAVAQSEITVEERQAAVEKGRFEVVKARLSMGEVGLVSEIEAARGKLALADAEQRLREAEAAVASAKANAGADRDTRERRIVKVEQELTLAQTRVTALHVKAPVDGTVSILPNYRASMSPGSSAPEFRTGDKVWPGAMILELPDLSSVFLTARIDEGDRGQLALNQTATIRVDAIADRDYHASVSEISVLARIDYNSGWPPPKQFDLEMAITDPDTRLRPGMSAMARITVGSLPDVLLVPSASIFFENGQTVVFRLGRRAYEAVPVEIIRRGRDQAAVKASLEPGDRIARRRPGETPAEPAS
jgi:multidrug efflux pump subunit AcrA (membrane-fusion protein)